LGRNNGELGIFAPNNDRSLPEKQSGRERGRRKSGSVLIDKDEAMRQGKTVNEHEPGSGIAREIGRIWDKVKSAA
jgi:hypothetical protein